VAYNTPVPQLFKIPPFNRATMSAVGHNGHLVLRAPCPLYPPKANVEGYGSNVR
jgi:hypothetical protein